MKSQVYANRLADLEKKYTKRQVEYSLIEQDHNAEVANRDALASQKESLEQVAMILMKTADKARDAGRQRMEKVVTKALKVVFGPDFSFEIILDESGGKPTATFHVVTPDPVSGELIKNEPQTSRGGGINDIVAFALQVATLVVYNNPKIQGPIILDEPGKHVSEDYVVRFGQFLEFISRTFNRQIFMVTHQPHLAATASKSLISQLVGGHTVISDNSVWFEDEDNDENQAETHFEQEEV